MGWVARMPAAPEIQPLAIAMPNPNPSPNPNPNLTKEEYDALFDPWVRCPHNMAADRQAG